MPMYALVRRLPMTAACVVAALVVPGSAQAVGVHPRIGQVHVERAPIGERGGIAMPSVYCSDLRTEPRNQVTVTNRETDKTKTYTWVGSYPNAYFPRVQVGTYRVVTHASCKDSHARKVDVVEVTEKTAGTTMSRSEFDSIANGMTKREVRRLVGYRGEAGGAYAGTVSRRYDLMPFWAWSYVNYRDGRVVAKYWDVGHD